MPLQRFTVWKKAGKHFDVTFSFHLSHNDHIVGGLEQTASYPFLSFGSFMHYRQPPGAEFTEFQGVERRF
jgi:hypothetical protein